MAMGFRGELTTSMTRAAFLGTADPNLIIAVSINSDIIDFHAGDVNFYRKKDFNY